MTRPDFLSMAREWLKTTTGYANPTTERRLAEELDRVWQLGVSQAAEAVTAPVYPDATPRERIVSDALVTVLETRIRALLEKPTDPRGN